jgi:acetyl esterase/lipase
MKYKGKSMKGRMIWIVAAPVLAVVLWFSRDAVRLALFRPTEANLSYGIASPAQKLDIYLPENGRGPYPVVVFIHGGAFEFGDKRERTKAFVQRVQRVNAAGLAFVSINYRMAQEAAFPAAAADAHAAVRWLRANAGRYHLDPGRIAVWGQSAGANLALLVGVANTSATFADQTIAPEQSSNVSAVVAMFPPINFLSMDAQLKSNGCPPEKAKHDDPGSAKSEYLRAPVRSVPAKAAAASPVTYVDADAPTMLLQHGTKDCTVPYQQSVLMDRVARKHGARSRLMLFKGARHMDPVFETAGNTALVLRFLQQALAKPLPIA